MNIYATHRHCIPAFNVIITIGINDKTHEHKIESYIVRVIQNDIIDSPFESLSTVRYTLRFNADNWATIIELCLIPSRLKVSNRNEHR